jgi:nitrite reductase/ring-hydroxylating ferredoxin subunit
MSAQAGVAGARNRVEVPVGRPDEFLEGAPTVVEAEGLRYVVFNLGGSLYALRDQCPHQGAQLSCGVLTGAMMPNQPGDALTYDLEGEVISCPWHRWKFEIRTGRSLFSVDRRNVLSVPVSIVGEQVVLTVPRARVRRPRA